MMGDRLLQFLESFIMAAPVVWDTRPKHLLFDDIFYKGSATLG